MESAGTPPALAEAADLLSGRLQKHLRRLGRLLRPHAERLERRFLARLRRLGFDNRQRKALAAITTVAASRILGAARPPADFFEQVDYNGRRLAKLYVEPGRIVEALRECDVLLGPVLDALEGSDRSDALWVLEQLHFGVVLTLNNAFYQVREAETQTYQELFQAELESEALDQLLERMLGTLCRFCRARAATLFLAGGRTGEWRLRAAIEGGHSVPAAAAAAGSRRLAVARCVTSAALTRRLALDKRWRRGYRSCWSIPLAAQGRTAGVMQFGFSNAYEWLPRELELLTAAAERCLQAAEKARLAEQLAEREAQVRRLAGHMMRVEERERKRIRSELHDEAGQSLLCLRLQLEMLERMTPETASGLRGGLAEARMLTERTVDEIRRLIGDLSPAVLEQFGLPAALRQLAGRLRRLHGMKVSLRIPPMTGLGSDIARLVYRLVQECVNNIARHSSASHVNISVALTDEQLRLRVGDDGVGFDPDAVPGRGESCGLAGMRERVALFGGEFSLRSRPGCGTRILIELPVRAREQS